MTSSDEAYASAIQALVPKPEGGYPKAEDMTPAEKALLRPMAETFAMLDGNAFFGAFTDEDGNDVHYEQYLPEAKALFDANGGMNGAAGNASFALAAKEADAFAAILDDPPPPSEKLRELLADPSRSTVLDPKQGFMDGTDFLHELGQALGGNVVYPSAEDLKEKSGHDVTDCGIAEVEVRFVRWVEEPTPVAEMVERHRRRDDSANDP